MKPLGVYLALASPSIVTAHYEFANFLHNGEIKGAEYQYIRPHTGGYDPVWDIDSTDIRCNRGALGNGNQTGVFQVAPGETIGMRLRARDGSLFHPGPLLVYMSKAPGDVRQYDGSGDWFKVSELSPVFEGGKAFWPAQWQTNHTFQLPQSTPPGQYLVRMEHIAVHFSEILYSAQFYISCAQIEVSGSGQGTPSPLVRFPGAYNPMDRGILFRSHEPYFVSYQMPGPKVWSGA